MFSQFKISMKMMNAKMRSSGDDPNKFIYKGTSIEHSCSPVFVMSPERFRLR